MLCISYFLGVFAPACSGHFQDPLARGDKVDLSLAFTPKQCRLRSVPRELPESLNVTFLS